MRELSVIWARIPAWSPRNPAWWLFAVVTAVSVLFTVYLFALNGVDHPVAIAIAVPSFAGLTLLWWWLARRVQVYARISRTAMWAAFLWGAAVATFAMALWGNSAVIAIVAKQFGIDVGIEYGPAIAAPLVEETAKGLGIVAVLLAARARLRTPVDGIILGLMVGLGFSMAENLLYVININVLTFAEEPAITTVALVFVRGVFTGIPGHELMTATFGAGLYYLWPGWGQRRIGRGLILVAAAIGYHALWNSPIPYLGGVAQTYGTLFLISICGIALFIWLARVARRGEQSWFRAMLTPEVAAGTVDYRYVEAMRPSTGGRRAHRRDVVRTYGWGAQRQQVALEAALVDLANARSLGDEVAAQRARATLAPTVAATPAT